MSAIGNRALMTLATAWPPSTHPVVDRPARTATSPTTEGVAALASVANALADNRVAVEDLSLRQPTLDEVFLTLTGAPAEADQPSDEAEEAHR